MEDDAAAARRPTNPLAQLTNIPTSLRPYDKRPHPYPGGSEQEFVSLSDEFSEMTRIRSKLLKFRSDLTKMEENDQKLVQKKRDLVESEKELESLRDEYEAELELQLERVKNEKKQLELGLASKDMEVSKLKAKLRKVEELLGRMLQL